MMLKIWKARLLDYKHLEMLRVWDAQSLDLKNVKCVKDLNGPTF